MAEEVVQIVVKLLRDLAQEKDSPGINYSEFKRRLKNEPFIKGQLGPLKMRMQLLESFLYNDYTSAANPGKRKQSTESGDLWAFKKGTLTIVDLSCPFVEEDDACALFNICLSLFLERRSEGGRLVVLDEAHKVSTNTHYVSSPAKDKISLSLTLIFGHQFLSTDSREAIGFTNTLLSLIRQQRHLATRVIIATQEPTLSPSLLDLCNVTIVHRFSSPAWYSILERHLAGALLGKIRKAKSEDKAKSKHLFDQIVRLGTGEALVFCPTAMLDVVSLLVDDDTSSQNNGSDGEDEASETDNSSDAGDEGDDDNDNKSSSTTSTPSKSFQELETRDTLIKQDAESVSTTSTASKPAKVVQELGTRYVPIKVRQRLTTDGGRSILAE